MVEAERAMSTPPTFSWEREMPYQCQVCDSNRFISGILLQNADLKRENDALKRTLQVIQDIAKALSRETRTRYEQKLKEGLK